MRVTYNGGVNNAVISEISPYPQCRAIPSPEYNFVFAGNDLHERSALKKRKKSMKSSALISRRNVCKKCVFAIRTKRKLCIGLWEQHAPKAKGRLLFMIAKKTKNILWLVHNMISNYWPSPDLSALLDASLYLYMWPRRSVH